MRAALALVVTLLAVAGLRGAHPRQAVTYGRFGFPKPLLTHRSPAQPDVEATVTGDQPVVTHPDARTIYTLPLP